MRRLIKSIILDMLTLWILAEFLHTMTFTSFSLLLASAFWLTIIGMLVQPVVKLLVLPLNFLTLGLLRWVPVAISLLLMSYFVDGVSLNPVWVEQGTYLNFSISEIRLGFLASLVAVSLAYVWTKRILAYLLE